MYNLVLKCLWVIAGVAIVLGAFGVIPYSPLSLIGSFLTLAVVSWAVNGLFAHIFKVPANVESYSITSLILFFIMPPATSIAGYGVLALTAAIAMASKYLLVVHHTHIANPAAFGAFVVGLIGFGDSWWVGNYMSLYPFLIVAGALIVKKIRRWPLFIGYALAALVGSSIVALLNDLSVPSVALGVLTNGALIFLGTVMLTEPLTMPSTRKMQIIYGVIVGFLATFTAGAFYVSLELALIIGNVFAFVVSPKFRLKLTLVAKRALSPDIHEFEFSSTEKIQFDPGQYLEWTLAHQGPDSRGNRRYFTVASSPTEQTIKLGIRLAPEKGSSFKNALVGLEVGHAIFAGQIAGDFVLPKDTSKKIVFVAGGIGVTPFRSMAKYLIDSGEKRDVTLFYAAMTPQSFVYSDVFAEAAQKFGMKTVNVLSGAKEIPQGWNGEAGFLTADMIKKYILEYTDHLFYLSGPNGMVMAYKDMLKKAGVIETNIHTDYFPGF
ncbi:MAG: hypothetical protein RL094_397 [Candidatus Parcubacteria bacterium]|jgi:ferredoxin-NADP reductase/Na+-translocating ferredoxin:NAD+ oxidoreductase RnfD subunit